MANCAKCQEEFEDELLNRMFISSEGYTDPICAVCALEINRRIHKNPKMMFKGRIAKALYKKTVKIKKRRGTWTS